MTEKQLLEKFVAWLTTQQNRNGSLYLENVARCYARYLQTAPPKLNLPLNEKDRSVYGCRTLEEFLLLCKTFRTAPNYKSVDYASSHNSFSAGLRCYERYMEYLSVKGEPQNKYYGDETMEERDVAVTENKPQLNRQNQPCHFVLS